MRPGIERLQLRARLPRGAGLLLHYLVLVGIVAVVLWLFVPRAIDQVQQATTITSTSQLHQQAKHSTGIKHDILTGLDRRLRRLPSGDKILHPALEVTKTAFEVLIGVFFVFAVAAYWIFERDRTIGLVQSMRQFEDYVVVPRVLGHATGLSPLVVLFSVSAIGLLLGGFYVLLAIPIAAVLATLIDVVVRDVDPAEQEVPAVLFAGAKEEGG